MEHVYIFINNISECFTLFREHRLRTSAMPIIEVVVIFFHGIDNLFSGRKLPGVVGAPICIANRDGT